MASRLYLMICGVRGFQDKGSWIDIVSTATGAQCLRISICGSEAPGLVMPISAEKTLVKDVFRVIELQSLNPVDSTPSRCGVQ